MTSYTSDTVTLAEPLTEEEVLEAHQGAWITTNSLPDGASTVQDARSLINTYAGVIKSISSDRRTITVWGWAIPLGSKGVPSLTHLETYYFTGYFKPTIFIGAPTKMFGSNIYMSYGGEKTGGTGKPATSLIHSLEWAEVDMNVNNDARPNSVSMHGLTITPLGNAAALTRESYDLTLAGAAPILLRMLDGCGSMAIESSSFNLPAKCPLNLPATAAEKTKNVEVFDFGGSVQANNHPEIKHAIDLQFWLAAGNLNYLVEANKGATFKSVIPHLGVMVDAQIATSSDQSHAGKSGSNFADLEWSQHGNMGGLSICGYSENCGFSVLGTGEVDITSKLTISKNLQIQNGMISGLSDTGKYTGQLYAMPSGDWRIGTQVSGGGNIRGVNHIYAEGYVETLKTPKTSSASCSAGEFTDDANYHYVCVAPNKWRRVALSDF